MGTDIHMVAQVERTYHGGTYWSTIYPPAWWPRSDWDTKQIAELVARIPDGEAVNDLAWRVARWGNDRNYDLFGILADVRNASGFAGIQRLEQGWPAIAPERGYPDAFDHDCDMHDRVWMGDHSHTWLTLAELFAYPWTTTRQRVGLVTLEQFTQRLTTGTGYETWCGETSGPGIVTLPADVVRASLRGNGLAVADGVRVHVRDSWGVTAAEACEWWHDTLIPAFQRLIAEHGTTPDKVRLVMGFDS